MPVSRERGYTLIEVVTVVVIVGIVVLPLSGVLRQALTLVPQSGQRTQTATDSTALLATFAADVEQAQHIDTYSQVQQSTPITNLDTAADPFTESATTTAMFTCQASASLTLAVLSWKDLTRTTPATVTQTYKLVTGAAAGGRSTVDIQRTTAGTPVSYLRGSYCTTNDAVVTVTFAPSGSTSHNADLSIVLKNLKDGSGSAIQTGGAAGALELHGTVRVED